MSSIGLVWRDASGPPVSSLGQLMLSGLAPLAGAKRNIWSDHRVSLAGSFPGLLPEDRFDHQPLWSADGLACLVADVRLDNRTEVADELSLTHAAELSDAALLMRAWTRWGYECLDHILGGFSFAIWRPTANEVFVARDHTGERPFFYHRSEGLLALASLPKGLLAIGVPGDLDESGVASWLANTATDPTPNLFRHIQRVPPGHYLRATRSGLECRRYWHPSDAKPIRYKRNEDYAEAMAEVLDGATEPRLRSTGAVGCLLSAGLDSSSVTASAALISRQQEKSIYAFTAVPRPGFQGAADPNRLADEGDQAAQIASLYPNVRHERVDSTGVPLVSTMRLWTDAMDEPAVNVINLLWFTAILNRADGEGIGTLLEGIAGNITISWNTWSVLGHLFNRLRWITLFRTVQSLRHKRAISLKTAVRNATRTLVPPGLNRKLLSYKTVDQDLPLLHPEWIERFGIRDRIFDTIYNRPRPLNAERALLFSHYDLGCLHAACENLTGIQLRDPTADKRVYEFCFGIPPEQYLADSYTRSLARRAAKGRLPDAVRLRESRGLQGADWYIPMTESLAELRDEFSLIEQSPLAQQALDLQTMRKLLTNWPTASFHAPDVYSRHHYALIAALSMGYFLRSHEKRVTPAAI